MAIKVDSSKAKRFTHADYTSEEIDRFKNKAYTEEEKEIFRRHRLSEKATDIISKKSTQYGSALKANIENAYRKHTGHYIEPARHSPKDSAVEFGSPEYFARQVRQLDPPGAKYEDAGDLASARNSRIAQANALIDHGENYASAGNLYESAGELSLAIDSYKKYLKHGGHYGSGVSELSMNNISRRVGDLEKKLEVQNKRTERKRLVSMSASIFGLVGGTFLISTKITANVVGMSAQTSSFLGIGFLIVGLISGFFYLKNKRKSKHF